MNLPVSIIKDPQYWFDIAQISQFSQRTLGRHKYSNKEPCM